MLNGDTGHMLIPINRTLAWEGRDLWKERRGLSMRLWQCFPDDIAQALLQHCEALLRLWASLTFANVSQGWSPAVRR